jgi:hypothetical protein
MLEDTWELIIGSKLPGLDDPAKGELFCRMNEVQCRSGVDVGKCLDKHKTTLTREPIRAFCPW